MGATNIHFEMAEKSRGVCCGGIGAIHLMVQKLGLPKDLDQRLPPGPELVEGAFAQAALALP